MGTVILICEYQSSTGGGGGNSGGGGGSGGGCFAVGAAVAAAVEEEEAREAALAAPGVRHLRQQERNVRKSGVRVGNMFRRGAWLRGATRRTFRDRR